MNNLFRMQPGREKPRQYELLDKKLIELGQEIQQTDKEFDIAKAYTWRPAGVAAYEFYLSSYVTNEVYKRRIIEISDSVIHFDHHPYK
jgi:hypothetical protein